MKNKNWVVIGVFAVILMFMAIYGFGNGFKASITEPLTISDFDGEFSDSAVADLEMGGTDLVANTSYAESNEAFTVTYETNVDLNGTDGVTNYLAFPIEVSGGDMQDLQVEGELGSTIATTEAVIRNVYVIENEEGLTIDSSNALSGFIVDLDSDQDKFDIESDEILDGEYVFVVELKGIATSTIADAETLLTVTFDADSDDNDAVDEGTVTIINAI